MTRLILPTLLLAAPCTAAVQSNGNAAGFDTGAVSLGAAGNGRGVSNAN
jgi:hypothetical protein